ncbi:hypothetical protein SAMN05428949_5839 [Chitinophaga sp. YR627]|nr:hypothetical protein SAMN05428949_5839 [Chitinophaga sp. YR627]
MCLPKVKNIFSKCKLCPHRFTFEMADKADFYIVIKPLKQGHEKI